MNTNTPATFAKIVAAAIATFAFLLILVVVYFIHARWLLVDVVLYSALLDVAVATFVTASICHWLGPFQIMTAFERIQMIGLWLLAGYAIAISVPTVIDRSLSFYLLEKLAQRGGGIRQNAFSEVFVDEYMKEHRLVEVRLTEQLASGTIVIRNGCVLLTPRGQRIASFSRAFRMHLLPRRRLLMGAYSDALVDPFRQGVSAKDYQCTDTH